MKIYTHLHVHSEYSLLDGSAKITELVSRASAMGMTSIALTDHGVMYGAIDFYKAAHANGIKPILGCEVYVAAGSRHEKTRGEDGAYTHLVLLAENHEGWQNLIKLVSLGFTEGFYYKPRVDTELLEQYHGGLIALSGCLAGSIPRAILQSNPQKAKAEALLYNKIFGQGNFFIELQDHGLSDQKYVNPALINLSKETGIPLVATNDVHYISREDAQAHDVLLCIQTNKTVADTDRLRYEGDQFYLKSPEEMSDLFSYIPEAVENTQKIAERCNVEIEFNKYKLPKYPLPPETLPLDYFVQLCEEGLKHRYGDDAPLHRTRLQYEIDTIADMGFVDYFLVVWDFIKYAKDNDILVGPGRGSAAGSIVAYVLFITDVDPIRFGLVFERFLNPERISMPDIDIDFCYERRQEVIDYVIRKYGADHVAQIITFGTMAAKAAIRDVGRALAMPYADVDRIAKMVPFELGISIARAIELNPELKKAAQEEDDTQELLEMSMRLEGLPRHASTHAAGVVICDAPVDSYVPLYQADGQSTTQFSMNTLEELGLLKMDFLGLRTLTVIRNAITEVERRHKTKIDFDEIGYSDTAAYRLISSGKTEGVFQLESAGMKSFIKDLQPDCLDDVMAGIALYRPGPMDSIPKYVQGRHNEREIEYTHPALEPILNTTYGCIVYQEQVMKIVQELAGYSLAQSDLVRRAMSKKQTKVMAKERQHFIEGCHQRGIAEKDANKIFDDMSDFARYAFPQPHAAAYAMIAYQTAWLKHYYPIEFMAASMTSVMGYTPKLVEYIQVCKKMGIKVLPPDINEGFVHFSVSDVGIRFALSAIKNVGRGVIDALVTERSANGAYAGITNFISRLTEANINRRCLESLIKAGAFDSLGGKRAQYIAIHKNILDGISNTRRRTIEGQMNLFEVDGQESIIDIDDLPAIKELESRQLLNDEKEVLGLYVSGHPLSDYENVLSRYTNAASLEILNKKDKENIVFGGMITNRSIKYTRATQKPMAFISVEDVYGSVEVIVFSKLYEKHGPRLMVDQVVVIEGQVSLREDEDAVLIANNIRFYNELTATQTFWVKLPKSEDMRQVANILQSHPGDTQVKVYDEMQKKRFVMENGVSPSPALFKALSQLLGDGFVKLV